MSRQRHFSIPVIALAALFGAFALLTLGAAEVQADYVGIRPNGSLWIEFGPGLFKACKRIDWYRGHLPKTQQPNTDEKAERSQQSRQSQHPKSRWVEMDLTKVNSLTLKSSDDTFNQTLDLIKTNFLGRFNMSPEKPCYQAVNAADGALILYASDVDFKPEQWFCMPHLLTNVKSGEKMYPDVLAVIPLTRETLGCDGDLYKAQLAELDALMHHRSISKHLSVDQLQKLARLQSMKKEENQKFGFIDKAGKMVFNAGDADDLDVQFKDGLLRVKEHGKMQFWNKAGKKAFEGEFDDALQFSEGRCAVARGGKWGYIDTTGRLIVEPTYDNAGFFHEKLAPVCDGGRWGYLNADGKLVIQTTYELASCFSEGLAAVCQGGKIGYIDTSGNCVIKPEFDEAGSFSEGLTHVTSVEGAKGSHHMWFIDKTGKKILDYNELELKYDPKFLPQSGSINSFGGYREIFVGQKPRLGSKDCSRYFEHGTYEFHDGLCDLTFGARGEERSHCRGGYIDKHGEIVIKPSFQASDSFHDGLAYVCVERNGVSGEDKHDGYGFINTKGEFVIKPKFSLLEPFSDGLSQACSAGFKGTGFIDKSGEWVIPPSVENPEPFSDGLARVGSSVDIDMLMKIEM